MTDNKETEQPKKINRRDFLRASILGVGAASLLFVPHQLTQIVTADEEIEVTPQPSKHPSTVILDFEDDVSESDREIITDSLIAAEEYFDALGVKVSRPSYMKVQVGKYYPGTSSGGGKDYRYFWQTNSDGWQNADEKFRKRSLIHEYAHMVQDDLIQNENSRDLVPIWLNEGSAEVFSEDALIKNDVMTFDEVKQLRLPYYYNQGENVLPLEAYGLADVRNPVPVTWEAYNMSSLAVRNLIGNFNVQALIDFYNQIHLSGDDWQLAFEKVFHVVPNKFYQKFELLRRQRLSPLDVTELNSD